MVNTPEYNSHAWDKKVEDGVTYTKPVSKESIEKCKAGEWNISVTAGQNVPREWFPKSLEAVKILCLASGGGQQGPILAAAGAEVTVMDISSKQLDQDELVAEREGLELQTIRGEMTDLSAFADESFDYIVHPVSNVFIEDVRPVWKEAYRVLKYKGIMIAGFMNPVLYLFDDEQEEKGNMEVVHTIPYSSVSADKIETYIKNGEALEFGHTLDDQIKGQTDAGFVIAGFYEDDFGGARTIDRYIKTMIATKAIKINLDSMQDL